MKNKIYRALVAFSDGRRIVWSNLTMREAIDLYEKLITITRLEGFGTTEVVEVEWGITP